MSALVVDASVLVAAAADPGEVGSWAETRLAEADHLAAPHLVLVEAASALRRLEAEGTLDPQQAASAHEDLLRLDLTLYPYPPFAGRVWQLRHGLTSYDGWYVALAEALQVPLVTLDRRLAGAPGVACLFVAPER